MLVFRITSIAKYEVLIRVQARWIDRLDQIIHCFEKSKNTYFNLHPSRLIAEHHIVLCTGVPYVLRRVCDLFNAIIKFTNREYDYKHQSPGRRPSCWSKMAVRRYTQSRPHRGNLFTKSRFSPKNSTKFCGQNETSVPRELPGPSHILYKSNILWTGRVYDMRTCSILMIFHQMRSLFKGAIDGVSSRLRLPALPDGPQQNRTHFST